MSDLPFSALNSLQVEVSSACNLSCAQCFRHLPGHVTALLDEALWDACIKPHLGQMRNVHLVGIGEPLLHPHLFTFLDDARSAGALTGTTSNLQLVTPDVADRLVASGLTQLSYSCDGATPETYAAIRRGGTLAQLEAALAAIVVAKDRHRTDLPKLVVNFGASQRNIEELVGVCHLAHRYDTRAVVAYHNIAFDEQAKRDSLFWQQERSDRAFVAAIRYCRQVGMAMLTTGLFFAPPPARPKCEYPTRHLYVHADGRVGPCCMDWPQNVILGDLREQTLEQVWLSDAMREFRRKPPRTCSYCADMLRMDVSDPRYLFHVTKGVNHADLPGSG